MTSLLLDKTISEKLVQECRSSLILESAKALKKISKLLIHFTLCLLWTWVVQHNANDQWNHTKRILSALDVAQCDTTNLCYSISVTASECATFDMNDKLIYNGQLLCCIQCRHSVMVVAGWSLQLDDFCYSLNNIYTKKKYHISLAIDAMGK